MDRKRELIKLIYRVQDKYPSLNNIYIPPELSKRLYSLIYILDDIKICRESSLKLLAMINDAETNQDFSDRNVFDVLWYGIITTYGRCFTSNKGKFRYLDNNVLADNPNILSIHASIMTLRHSFVAHRDETHMFETAVLWVKSTDGHKYFIAESLRRSFEISDLEDYIRLFDFLLNKLDELQIKEEKLLTKKILEAGPLEMSKHIVKNLFLQLALDK